MEKIRKTLSGPTTSICLYQFTPVDDIKVLELGLILAMSLLKFDNAKATVTH